MEKIRPGRKKGYVVSDETKRKISEAMMGRRLSKKHKRNIGAGMKKTHLKKRMEE